MRGSTEKGGGGRDEQTKGSVSWSSVWMPTMEDPKKGERENKGGGREKRKREI